jgi:hypothetical protein
MKPLLRLPRGASIDRARRERANPRNESHLNTAATVEARHLHVFVRQILSEEAKVSRRKGDYR